MKFSYRIIDLTHALHEAIPWWEGGCGFQHPCEVNYSGCETPTKFKKHSLQMPALAL